MKNKIALIALLVCAVILGAAAVTLAADNVPTVVFDASAKTFSFENCSKYNYGGDEIYPDLFPEIKNAMPGDSFAQKIRVKIINNYGDTVKLYLRVENPNADYEKILDAVGNTVTFSAEYSYDTVQYRLLNHSTDYTSNAIYSSAVGDSVYLGAYKDRTAEREILLTFDIDKTAGNELAGLKALVDWVFVAEVIPSEPSPTRPPSGPGGLPIEDQTQPRNENRVWNIDMVEEHVAYIVGYAEDGLVHPERPITRAEVSTIIFRLLSEESRAKYWKTTNTFADVSSEAWYNNAISTLQNAGVVQGYDGDMFHPNAHITRAELVTMLSRVVTAIEPRECNFTDIEGHWAQAAIENAYSVGLLTGYPDGAFRPDQEITRAEAIAIFNRLLGREPAKEDIIRAGMIEWPDNMDQSAWYYLDIQEATNTHEHGYYDAEHIGNREYWVKLEMNVDWVSYENSDAAAPVYYTSSENYKK